ncbi:hypothetical protein AHF37_03121 [Paragonimus kellicotti]|nr:hypothetical protein AHF37_03121 [Paragonimus kellicotti]
MESPKIKISNLGPWQSFKMRNSPNEKKNTFYLAVLQTMREVSDLGPEDVRYAGRADYDSGAQDLSDEPQSLHLLLRCEYPDLYRLVFPPLPTQSPDQLPPRAGSRPAQPVAPFGSEPTGPVASSTRICHPIGLDGVRTSFKSTFVLTLHLVSVVSVSERTLAIFM